MRLSFPIHNAALLKYGSIGVVCLIVFIGIYVAIGPSEVRQDIIPPDLVADYHTVFPSCAFSDKTFCSTEAVFRTLVAEADISDILERQIANNLVCPASHPLPVCQQVGTRVEVQLFAIDETGSTAMLTRNGYIAYFRQYFAANGPFFFVRDTASGDTVDMVFQGQSGAEYRLHFQKSATSWQLNYPLVNRR